MTLLLLMGCLMGATQPVVVWSGGNGAFRLTVQADGHFTYELLPDPRSGRPRPKVRSGTLPISEVDALAKSLRAHDVCGLKPSARTSVPEEGHDTLALAMPGLRCEVSLLSNDWSVGPAAPCAHALQAFTASALAHLSQKPARLELTEAQLHGLSAPEAASLQQSFRNSGTSARLAHAGLHLSQAPVQPPASSLHAAAAFRTEGDHGLVADVYFFDDPEALVRAERQLPSKSPDSRVTQNGAFLVRVQGPASAHDRIADVINAIAGEE